MKAADRSGRGSRWSWASDLEAGQVPKDLATGEQAVVLLDDAVEAVLVALG